MIGLRPNTKYYYKVGSGNTFSNVFSFTTLPINGDKSKITWTIVADMGTGEVRSPAAPTTLDKVTESVVRGRSQGVFHAGDLSYARGVAVFWDKWMQLIEPIGSKVPYMVGVGNHEQVSIGTKKDISGYMPYHPAGSWANYKDDSHGECSVPVYHRFRAPKTTFNNLESNSVFWYSYQVGTATFVAWSSEHDCTPDSPQYKYLEATLKSIDRSKFPWVIMLGHRPLIGIGSMQEHFRSNIGVLMKKYKVDISFVGHLHSYMRSFPIDSTLWNQQEKSIINNNSPTPNNAWGTIQILIGNAGFHIDGDKNRKVTQKCNGGDKFFCAAKDNQYGFGEVEFDSNTFKFNYYHSNNDFNQPPVESITLNNLHR
jgi:hypothetical protein